MIVAALGKVLVILILLVDGCVLAKPHSDPYCIYPIIVPPILHILNLLKVDRRLIASVLTFGLTAPYILLPWALD